MDQLHAAFERRSVSLTVQRRPDPGIGRLLRRKYGWQKRARDLLSRRGAAHARAVLEISLHGPSAAH